MDGLDDLEGVADHVPEGAVHPGQQAGRLDPLAIADLYLTQSRDTGTELYMLASLKTKQRWRLFV